MGAVLPYGYLEYCAKTPPAQAQCAVKQVTTSDLAALNTTVNHAISGRSDRQGFDVWTAFPADRAGDCDDYVMTKRAALLALGVAAASLQIVAGDTPEGNAHLVLYVLAEGKTWVLDNRIDGIYEPGGGPGLTVRGIQSTDSALWQIPLPPTPPPLTPPAPAPNTSAALPPIPSTK